MVRSPHIVEVKLREFFPAMLDPLTKHPYCFFLDSAKSAGKDGRYSFFGRNPVKIFWSMSGTITVDGRTFIDNPVEALAKFESAVSALPADPYLPFQGGLVGYIGHAWPEGEQEASDPGMIPDAWFGLYDTVLAYDHLENSCWITSFGLDGNLQPDEDVAKERCDELLSLLDKSARPGDERYAIKPYLPEPVPAFSEREYGSAVKAAKKRLGKKEWQRVNIAQRFHSPVETSMWNIHNLLRNRNPTPFASFLRCGNFELSSTSPSCFLQIDGSSLKCNVVQRSMPKSSDPTEDGINRAELLFYANDVDPIVAGDENSLEEVFSEKLTVEPARLESDARAHYVMNRIVGTKPEECPTALCLASVMPGASMTGVPKKPVNSWLKKTEPARRNAYTGAIGYIGPKNRVQFNTAVRTMVTKGSIAYVHAGQSISEETNPEEAFHLSKSNVSQMFEDIKSLGKAFYP